MVYMSISSFLSTQDDSTNVTNAGRLTIGGGSALAVTNAVTATGNSTILLQGMNGSAQVNGQWQGQGVSLTVGNVQVDAGSSINADAQGYAGNNCSGPGSGPGWRRKNATRLTWRFIQSAFSKNGNPDPAGAPQPAADIAGAHSTFGTAASRA